MEMGEIIKRRRKELGLTQSELAKMLGYQDKSSISKIEKGQSDIYVSDVKKFAKALKTVPAYIMGWTDDPSMVCCPSSQKTDTKLSYEETRIIKSYRSASEGMQDAVAKLLDVEEDHLMPIAAHDNGASLDQVHEDADMI